MPVAGLGGLVSGVGGALTMGLMNAQGDREARRQIQAGGQQFQDWTSKGINQAQAGREQAQALQNPYLAAGQQALGQQQALLSQGSGATMPQQSQAFSFDAWKDPSAQYAMGQANTALKAQGIAKGGAGGGLAKALQANAAALGGQQYQNAFQRYLSQNQQDFGQQQQQWANQMANWQNQLAGQQALSGQGQQASTSLMDTLGRYDTQTGNMYSGIGQNWMDVARAKAGLTKDLWSQGADAAGSAWGSAGGFAAKKGW